MSCQSQKQQDLWSRVSDTHLHMLASKLSVFYGTSYNESLQGAGSRLGVHEEELATTTGDTPTGTSYTFYGS